MSYVYALQVPVGREIDIQTKIVTMMERTVNPGIIAVHALKAFEHIFSENGFNKKWKAKIPGYIFVVVERVSGFRMAAECWQFLKRIPVVRVLNTFIQPTEWNAFFEKIEDELDSEVQIIECGKTIKKSSKELKDYWNGLVNQVNSDDEEGETNDSQSTDIQTDLVKSVESNKQQRKITAGMRKLIKEVKKVVNYGGKTVYTMPHKIYKAIENELCKTNGNKQTTVQSILQEIKLFLFVGTVIGCRV
jgi:hypothetical protein